MKKILVLLSGGIDSTTCLAMAVDKVGKDNVFALSVFYGQKHDKELVSATNVAKHYGVHHHISYLDEIFELSNCALLAGREEQIKHTSYGEQLAEMGGMGTVSTYVPFRNGLLLSYAASIAVSMECDIIYYGAHADDAVGGAYPDCTEEFNSAIRQAILAGTGHLVYVIAPLIQFNKIQVVRYGLDLEAPYSLTWSCYEGGEKACGTCATCRDRQIAFVENGHIDPIKYEVVK